MNSPITVLVRPSTPPLEFHLNPGYVWESLVRNVEWVPLLRQEDPSLHQCQLLANTSFSQLDKPKPISREFQYELENLAKAGNRVGIPPWFRYASDFVLSPDQLNDVLNNSLNFNDYLVLTDPDHPTPFLFVNSRYKPHRTRRILSRLLGAKSHDTSPIFIAPDNANYGIELNDSYVPLKLREEHECHTLLVLRDVDSHRSLEEFWEQKLDQNVKSVRLLTDFEKKWLAKQQKDPKLSFHQISVIELHDSISRNAAFRRYPHLNMFFCDSMVDERLVVEETILHICYNVWMTRVRGVCVVIDRDEDLNRAGHHFRCLGVEVTWKNKDYELDLFNLPAHLINFEDMEWFVNKVCDDHDIKRIEAKPLWKARKHRTPPTEEQLTEHIDRHFYDIGCFDLHALPVPDPMAHTLDLTTVPWRIQSQEVKQNVFNFTCHFEEGDIGRRMVEKVMERWRQQTGTSLTNDNFKPELTPIFRAFMPISNELRSVFNRTIERFDRKIRYVFRQLSEENDQIMMKLNAYHFGLRVCERIVKNDNERYIGVEGWEPPVVRHFLNELRQSLGSLEITNPELMSGIGELYAKSLEEKWEVLIDIDKFQSKIQVFGDNAAMAIEDLRRYSTSKDAIEVHTDILGKYLNCFGHLQRLPFWRSSDYFRCRLLDEKKGIIGFSGTIESLETLLNALNLFSKNAMARCLERREEWKELECPICFTNVEGRDWYRQTCGHVMCRDCANGQVKAAFEQGTYRIGCGDCGVSWTAKDVLQFTHGGPTRLPLLDQAKTQTLMPLLHQALLRSNQLLRPCPTADCLGIRLYNSQTGREKNCVICDSPYCGDCLNDRGEVHLCGVHPPDMDPETRNYYNENTHPCPGCGMGTEKNNGCDHIECRCGTHFCWICGFAGLSGRTVVHHLMNAHRGDLFAYYMDGVRYVAI